MSKSRIRKEKIALTQDQIDDFLKSIKNDKNKKGNLKRHNERNYRMALTWFSVGFRVSEIVNFQVDWIERSGENFFIHIKNNNKPYAFKPKYGSTRRIAINKKLYKELMLHLAGRKTGYVFMPQTTKQYSRFHDKAIISMFNEYFKKTESIGRNLGSHTFRRTFASQLATSHPPVPIPKISYYLGHKQIETTIIYLRQIKTDDHTELLSADYLNQLLKY